VFFAVAEHRSYRKRSIPAKGVKNWLRWHTLTLIFGALTTIPTTILTVAGTDKIAEWYPPWVGPHITINCE